MQKKKIGDYLYNMKDIFKQLVEYELPSEEEENVPVPQYKIYCDMDGVLTNFEARFEHFSGMHPKIYENTYGTPAFWELIDVKVGIKFWSQMDWMPQGKMLWDFIAPHRPQLLTSPSRDNNSRLGKNLWVKENFEVPPKVIFAYSKDKQRYASPTSILIDDKKSNIREWIAAGGIGIRLKDGDSLSAIQKLITLGYRG